MTRAPCTGVPLSATTVPVNYRALRADGDLERAVAIAVASKGHRPAGDVFPAVNRTDFTYQPRGRFTTSSS